jgi:hypothetical protein
MLIVIEGAHVFGVSIFRALSAFGVSIFRALAPSGLKAGKAPSLARHQGAAYFS